MAALFHKAPPWLWPVLAVAASALALGLGTEDAEGAKPAPEPIPTRSARSWPRIAPRYAPAVPESPAAGWM